MKNIDLSIVIPFFNEEENLGKLHQEIVESFKENPLTCQVIYINDGSTDNSCHVLQLSVLQNKSTNILVSLVNLRKNFGQTAATSAGIDQAKGRLISFMDADLQSDPKDLVKFLGEINKGYDAVFGWRKNREDDFARSFSSKIANFIIQKLFNIPIHDVGCSLRVVKKEVMSDIHLYGESHRIMPVLIYWKGVSIKELVVNHRKRLYGKSKYGYSRVLKLLIDLITIKFLNTYGTKPAYVFGTFGIFSNLIGFFAMLVVLYQKIVLGVFVHRNPLFLIAVVFVMIGIQLILMGLLAELLVRTYFEAQEKTTYELKQVETL